MSNFFVRGGVYQALEARDPEILVEGPAGTGKTRGILEKLDALCDNNPSVRILIVRKHLVTLSTSALATFEEEVLRNRNDPTFFGGSSHEPASYKYANGSRIVVGGMDNPDKILSSFYDLIYVNEATQLTLEDWESLTARLRHGVIPNMRIIGDCNPASDNHWLNRRCQAGKTRRILTHVEDNPAYFDDDGEATELGAKYLSTLDSLTGSRYQRLRLGLWVGVENAVYAQFDRAHHVRDLPEDVRFLDGAVGVDYGLVHKSAGVAISVDQYGRRWVREAWGQPDTDDGESLTRAIGRLRQHYSIRRVRTDPNQGYLAGRIKGTRAQLGAGSRNKRIRLTNDLLAVHPGGRVLRPEIEARSRIAYGPWETDDSPGLLFVKDAPGIAELCDEIEEYHYVPKATDSREELVVARIDDDLVAAMEYAIEELSEPSHYDYSKLERSHDIQYRPRMVGAGV